MTNFKQYKRKSISELRPYIKGEILGASVSVSDEDKIAGSPKVGDLIARNPKNHKDQWLVNKQYAQDNLELIEPQTEMSWLDRLILEANQLSEKIIKLNEFLDSPEACKKLSTEYKKILQAQLETMVAYHGILDLRLSKAQ